MSKKSCRICIAWHGLPFYAYESLCAFAKDAGEYNVSFIGSEAKGCIKESVDDAKIDILWIDETKKTSFREIGIEVPHVFIKTSWHHTAFESLANEVRSAKGRVIIMADNTFSLKVRKILAAIYSRLYIIPRNWGAWVPGSRASMYMRYLGFSQDRIFTKLYCTSASGFEASVPVRKNRVLFVGRFEPEKNVKNLVAAWRKYKIAGGRIEELILVGSGSIKVISDKDVNISVHPWASQAEVKTFMEESEVFILPSKHDPWGVVLLEAALCECVMVASSNCGAAHDLIKNGVNGVIFEGVGIGDIQRALFDVEKLVGDRKRRGAAGKAARLMGERYSTVEFSRAALKIIKAASQ
jgi:glycosyltransferase involved in cell wall biosynthesis